MFIVRFTGLPAILPGADRGDGAQRLQRRQPEPVRLPEQRHDPAAGGAPTEAPGQQPPGGPGGLGPSEDDGAREGGHANGRQGHPLLNPEEQQQPQEQEEKKEPLVVQDSATTTNAPPDDSDS